MFDLGKRQPLGTKEKAKGRNRIREECEKPTVKFNNIMFALHALFFAIIIYLTRRAQGGRKVEKYK